MYMSEEKSSLNRATATKRRAATQIAFGTEPAGQGHFADREPDRRTPSKLLHHDPTLSYCTSTSERFPHTCRAIILHPPE